MMKNKKKPKTTKAVVPAAVAGSNADATLSEGNGVTTVEWTPGEQQFPSKLYKPTLAQLLSFPVKERKFLMSPWLREEQNCMVYAAAGVGKSLFALSLAIAVAGGGRFLNWEVQPKEGGGGLEGAVPGR